MAMVARDLNQRTDYGASTAVVSGRVASNGGLASDVPQMIPEAELLFWTSEWRELEGRALGQLANGEGREFANFRELAAWLLRAED